MTKHSDPIGMPTVVCSAVPNALGKASRKTTSKEKKMKLTYAEKISFSEFVLKTRVEQAAIRDSAVKNPNVSGPLIAAYRWAMFHL